MIFNDCLKQFSDGAIGKIVSPALTFEKTLSKMEQMQRPILARYFEVKAPTGIPQYAFVGTEYFREYATSHILSNGKGHTTAQALASGIMEMAERYSCYKHCSPGNSRFDEISSLKDLPGNRFKAQDLLALLNAGSRVSTIYASEVESARLSFYKGHSLDGRATYLPLGLLCRLSGTNGMASGNTLEEALLHGICEVIERYALAVIRNNKLRTPGIEPGSIDNPAVKDLMERLESKSNGILVKDFSLGLGIPVVGLVRNVNETSCHVTAGVASSPDEALVRALTENSQCEDAIHFEDVSAVSYHFSNPEWLHWDQMPRFDDRNVKSELGVIETILGDQGLRGFFTDATEEELDIPSVMVFITGGKHNFLEKSNSSAILENLTLETLNHGDTAAARHHVEIGKRDSPDRKPYFFYYEGIIFRAQRRHLKAIEYFKKSLQGGLDPRTEAYCLANIAICFFLGDRMDDALTYMLKLMDTHPSFCMEWCTKHACRNFSFGKDDPLCFCCLYNEFLGIRHLTGKQGQELETLSGQYLKERPLVLERLQKARMYFDEGKYERALKAAREAGISGGFVSTLHNIHHLTGLCYMEMQNWKGAVRELKKASAVTGGDIRVRRLLSHCMQRLKK